MATPQPTILCVDDDPDNLDFLGRVFRSGFRVLLAKNGTEALALLEKETIHAVVSDQRMPDMLGTKLLARVRAKDASIARVVLSGYADEGDIRIAIEAGDVQRYLGKPIKPGDIRRAVDDLMKAK